MEMVMQGLLLMPIEPPKATLIQYVQEIDQEKQSLVWNVNLMKLCVDAVQNKELSSMMETKRTVTWRSKRTWPKPRLCTHL
jgi:hypothetical protein